MQTIKIKGKDYVPVSERLKYLASNYDYAINTEYQYFHERKMWVVKAILSLKKGESEWMYTGHAQEIESDNYRDVNFTSALENAETSAVGRCIAFAGIAIDGGIASADEVNKAIARTEIDEVGEEKRMYLVSLLENTTYDEIGKERLASRIEEIKSLAAYEKALSNLQMNQIQDKDRIAMGLNYNQSDIKKTLNSK